MEGVKHTVKSMAGKEVGSVELSGAVFAVELQPHLVHDTVRWQLAKRRAGTHSTLTRSEMKATGKKPFKQKGTGQARAGSSVSPLWTGGAVVLGPQPRKYGYRLPRRTRAQALCSVLSDKVQTGNLIVVDDLGAISGKCKEFVAALAKLGLEERSADRGYSALVIVSDRAPEKRTLIERAARNVPGVTTLPVNGLNCHDLLRHRYLVVAKDCLAEIEARMAV